MVLVTGAKGQLGTDVCSVLTERKIDFLPVGRNELDIREKDDVKKIFDENDISAVIHCAAYTAVDKAEDDTVNCYEVNGYGTENIALECGERNIKLMYISTDYVFGGEGELPHEVNDEVKPLNAYGDSKWLGESVVTAYCDSYFVVRTSWVYGEKNTNFVHTMLRLSQSHDNISVVCDQIGSPTYSHDLAVLLCGMIETEKYGIYHATNEGFCSWADFARKIFSLTKKNVAVTDVTSEEYKSRAVRPLNSRLSKSSLDEGGFSRLPDWEDALKRYLTNIGEISE